MVAPVQHSAVPGQPGWSTYGGIRDHQAVHLLNRLPPYHDKRVWMRMLFLHLHTTFVQDDDVEMGDEEISLKCPITLASINIPAKVCTYERKPAW